MPAATVRNKRLSIAQEGSSGGTPGSNHVYRRKIPREFINFNKAYKKSTPDGLLLDKFKARVSNIFKEIKSK